uniref:Ig-like domain-containing protein n=1 Tax=Shewanella seohaensis TaxID=755175 RepID=UPI0036F1B4E8
MTYTTANGLVIDAQGNWSVDLTGTVLPDGTYPVVATVTDVAGNSKTVTQDVVIDTKIDQDGDGNTVAITSITQTPVAPAATLSPTTTPWCSTAPSIWMTTAP